jgi:ketosteroid isomerase-like protein
MNSNKISLVKLFTILIAITLLSCGKTGVTPTFSLEDDTKKVKAILKNIDDYKLDMNTKMSVYDDEVVHMAQGSRAITNKEDLRKVLEADSTYGHSEMTHELISIHSYQDMVLTRGRVAGKWYSAEGNQVFPFETNNIITFKRKEDGALSVWQVIFNRVALENY